MTFFLGVFLEIQHVFFFGIFVGMFMIQLVTPLKFSFLDQGAE